MLRVNALFSYAFAKTSGGDPDKVLAAVPTWAPTPRVMLDSGAFSAFQRGINVTVPDLIAWYRDMAHLNPIMAGLDVLYDAESTRANCEQMRDAGLDVFPTVHLGSDPRLVRQYAAAGWTRLALGGLVNQRVPIRARAKWVLQCQRVAAEHGVALHGFGWSPGGRATLETVRRFTTVDSTSWNSGTKYGQATILDGHILRGVEVKDKAAVYGHLSKDRDVQAEAITSILKWGNSRGEGRSHHVYALSGYAYLKWGEVIGTPVYLAAASRQMLDALYRTILKPQPEGATA